MIMSVQHAALFGYSLIILGVISILMVLYNVPRFFAATFFFISYFYITTAAWENVIDWGVHDWILYNVAIWGITSGIFLASFLVLYMLYQRVRWGGIRRDWTLALGVLIIGTLLLIGPFQDFAQVVMAGLDFNQADLWWHFDLINGVFPAGYLVAIPGLIFVILVVKWARANNTVTRVNRTTVVMIGD
jgi:hypothetical protein